MTKLCVDCKWYVGGSGAECKAPQNTKPNSQHLVTGEPGQVFEWLTCNMLRSFGFIAAPLYRACGKRARWFVAK